MLPAVERWSYLYLSGSVDGGVVKRHVVVKAQRVDIRPGTYQLLHDVIVAEVTSLMQRSPT